MTEKLTNWINDSCLNLGHAAAEGPDVGHGWEPSGANLLNFLLCSPKLHEKAAEKIFVYHLYFIRKAFPPNLYV